MSSDQTKIVLVMGVTGTGKTSFINSASGSLFPVNHNLDSCTHEVKTTAPFDLNGHRVVLVDTPGFGHSDKRDPAVLRQIAKYLKEHCISGVIYMHAFPEYPGSMKTAKHYFSVFSELCGSTSLDHVSIVMTRWKGHLPGSGSQTETDVQAVFEPVVKAGGCVVGEDHRYSRAREILHAMLDNEPVVLQIQRELADGKRHVCDTAAGIALNKRKEISDGLWKKVFVVLCVWKKSLGA